MNSEYRNPIYHIKPKFVLCGSSALEFMGLFVGYINASAVYVYQISDTDKAVPKEYTVIPIPERKIEYVEENGIKYTTFEQTVNDMLSDSRLEDPQALMEALNDYLYTYGKDDPYILPENISKYEYYKKESAYYYSNF